MVEVYPEEEFKLLKAKEEMHNYIRCPKCGRVLLDLKKCGAGVEIVARCRSCKKLVRIIVS